MTGADSDAGGNGSGDRVVSSGDANQPVVVVVGPTATGKTAAAIHLASALDGEIISADSMAVYRGLDVGTAKPSAAERAQARFHLIDVVEPNEQFSVAQYRALALTALEEIRARGRRAILVGGTGLYVRVLLEGYGLTGTPADARLRAELNSEAGTSGTAALHKRLAGLDPISAERIHPNDRIRIIRALEVALRTGEPLSAQHSRDAALRSRIPAIKIGLTAQREELYHRIDSRVTGMIEGGLEAEVRGLLARGLSPDLHPLRSLGYKEMIAHLQGEYDLNTAILTIQQNTRRFAKRQLTWFRAEPDLRWIDVGGKSPQEVSGLILKSIDAAAAPEHDVGAPA